MRRRDFIALAGATAACPVAPRAQELLPVIGFLGPSSPQIFATRLQAFHHGLGEAGYRAGDNVRIEYRWAGGDTARFPGLAADLARRPVTVLVAAGLAAALAAKAATTAIPILFFIGENPVELGLVATLNRPGANLTGVTTLNTEVGPKRLELARELVTAGKPIAVLINPRSPNADSLVTGMQRAADRLGLRLMVLQAGSERELEPVFAHLAERRAGPLVITTDAFFISRIERLAELSLRHAVPAIFQYREFVAAGALMSYGSSFLEPYRQVGVYTGRVLRGEKPADLPVQQATKVELFINLKTARALGIEVPPALLVRADEVIE
jgi:putative ABC transport system substrate-binding protein